jgi:class 3 adenylate cyclase/tetratricopeptide (TPR) repeat protein
VPQIEQYLPRLVREWDELAPGELHRSIEGSMVFVDVSGFTKMSERLARHGKVGAEEVTEVIGRTFDRLLGEAYAYGASLLKFGGDALLLFFQGDSHPLNACAAARGMRQTLRGIGRFETTAGQVSLRMSVGVHSGAFDFFLVGQSHRELIVAGPAATETTAMESAAAAGQILVSPSTARLLPRRNVGRPVGPGFLLSGVVDAIRAEIDPLQAKSELQEFLPKALRESLIAGEVEPEHRPVAVGFVHFMEFDHLVATFGSETAAAALDKLVRTIQAAVDSRGVTFLATDIAGDGGKIILAGGIPQATGNDEDQVLLALREVISSKIDLPVQVGVNWGPVFAGEIGPTYRRTFTVMGDTVNVAARLMSKASAGQILATRDVLDGSRTLFETTELEPFNVKGKRVPVQAYAVGDPTGSRGTDVSIPLIGRESELEILDRAWESAAQARGIVVELVAEPGMGKTRLLQEFLLRSGDSRTVRAECRLYQAATPYFPFRALLRQALEIEGLGAAETIDQLRKIVGEAAPALSPWLSLVGVVLDLEIEPSPEVAQLDDQFRRARTVAAVGMLLEAVVTTRTLFVMEDTHWMDDASRELLAGLLVGLERQPWMFILSRRPGDEGFVAPRSDQLARVELEPLTRAQAETLINSATSDSPLLPGQVSTLAERAAGNPLFLVELLRSLSSGSDVDSLPHSVEGLIAARIDRLPPADRQLLRRLAVLGNGFLAEHSKAVIPEAQPGSLVRTLRRLGDFVTLNHTGWVQFRHALIRDVAYQSLPFKTRSDLHRSVGDSIRAAVADHPESQAELLSLHYFYAQNWADAWHFSRVAGDNAKKMYATAEAATFYQRALSSARQAPDTPTLGLCEVLESLGDVLQQGGMFGEALKFYGKAGRVASDPIRRANILLKKAGTRASEGAYSAAVRDITLGRRLLANLDGERAAKEKARLAAQLAWLRQLQQHPRAALNLAQEALEEARAAGAPDALARAYRVLDASYSMLGQPSKAVFGPLALEIYERIDDLQGAAIINNNLGGQAYFAGDWNAAVSFYTRAQDAYQRAGNEPEAAIAGANIGEVLVGQGRLTEAATILQDASAILHAHHMVDAIFADMQLARLEAAKGDLEAAVEAFRAIRTVAQRLGEKHSQLEAAVHLSEIYTRLGDGTGALELLAAAQSEAGDDAELYACALARVRAGALASLGRTTEACSEIESGLTIAIGEGLQYEEALLLLARSKLGDGCEGDNRDWTGDAERLFQKLGVVSAVLVESRQIG